MYKNGGAAPGTVKSTALPVMPTTGSHTHTRDFVAAASGGAMRDTSLRRMRLLELGDVAQHLRHPDVLSNAEACLSALMDACAAWHADRGGAEDPVPVRVFLSVYMIALFPASVFDPPTEETVALTDAATALARQFDRLIKEACVHDRAAQRVRTSRLMALSVGFRERLYGYHRLYTAWAREDKLRLAGRLHGRLCALLGRLLDTAGPAEDLDATDREDLAALWERIERVRAVLARMTPTGPELLRSYDAASARLLEAHRDLRLQRQALDAMAGPLDDSD